MSPNNDRNNPLIPGFVWKLAPLVGSVGFLTSLADDPIGTLRDIILDVVLTFVLNSIISLLAQLFGLVAEALEQVASVPGILVNAAIGIGGSVGGAVLFGLNQAGNLYAGLIAASGPFGPIVAVLVMAVMIYVAIEVRAIVLDTIAPRLGDLLRILRGVGR